MQARRASFEVAPTLMKFSICFWLVDLETHLHGGHREGVKDNSVSSVSSVPLCFYLLRKRFL